ncbi:transporter substrate-binding domain-containing protein [uncultured Pseudodesulfovibrio sp.]|uniref:transporter substrate-binding domain-containing protein n=1 Tax=uncultured Pseudodesulfovibrio sp. TaxID=2035858 RepID=UPI0029C8CF47|nr:transporter substrate-binding domain-containing protein [uncultured Pseudodesulfovibrio sp.]
MRHCHHHSSSTIILCLLTALLLTPISAKARTSDTLTWLYFNFPPVYIRHDTNVTGYGKQIIDIINAETKNTKHRMLFATPGRMIEDIKAKKNVLILGLIKTPEREKIMYFSKYPCRLASASVIAIRSEDKAKFAPNGTASAKKLFDNKTLIFGDIPNIRYGALDGLVTENKVQHRTISTPEGLPHLLGMLVRKRIDWTITDPMAATYLERQNSWDNEIIMVPISEAPQEFIPGYIVAPKTEWGAKMMQHVDAILRKTIKSGRLKEILTPYAPKGLEAEFDASYKRLILEPAR